MTFNKRELNSLNIIKNEDEIKENSTTKEPIKANKEEIEHYIGLTSKGYKIEKIDGVYFIDEHLIVNKTYSLPSSWKPKDTYKEIKNEICKNCINKTAYEAWINMQSDAAAIGLNIYIASGYRSFDYQKGLYDKYTKKDGKVLADTYSARPGHSEHQSGLSFDLNSVDSSFAATPEGKWVNDNAYLYGYIIRYPENKTESTGYKYEPWHLRYVGTNLAKKLFNQGNWITMEDFFGIDSKYE